MLIFLPGLGMNKKLACPKVASYLTMTLTCCHAPPAPAAQAVPTPPPPALPHRLLSVGAPLPVLTLALWGSDWVPVHSLGQSLFSSEMLLGGHCACKNSREGAHKALCRGVSPDVGQGPRSLKGWLAFPPHSGRDLGPCSPASCSCPGPRVSSRTCSPTPG